MTPIQQVLGHRGAIQCVHIRQNAAKAVKIAQMQVHNTPGWHQLLECVARSLRSSSLHLITAAQFGSVHACQANSEEHVSGIADVHRAYKRVAVNDACNCARCEYSPEGEFWEVVYVAHVPFTADVNIIFKQHALATTIQIAVNIRGAHSVA